MSDQDIKVGDLVTWRASARRGWGGINAVGEVKRITPTGQLVIGRNGEDVRVRPTIARLLTGHERAVHAWFSERPRGEIVSFDFGWSRCDLSPPVSIAIVGRNSGGIDSPARARQLAEEARTAAEWWERMPVKGEGGIES